MIQDIQPHRFNVDFKPRPPGEEDCVTILQGSKVAFVKGAERAEIPRVADIRAVGPVSDDELLYLFSLDDKAFYFFLGGGELPSSFEFLESATFRGFEPLWMAFAGATAFHLCLWYVKNRFCGCCGGVMVPKGDERALRCASCGEVVYPRISPAVIVAVVDGDRLLLTRYANRPGVKAALVAGFMEIGETLEDTIRREVMEEVGLEVGNFRYYKSQPWAFSGSVLVGFYVDLVGADAVAVDMVELEAAAFVERGDIPPTDTRISLTSEMIEMFRLNRHPR